MQETTGTQYVVNQTSVYPMGVWREPYEPPGTETGLPLQQGTAKALTKPEENRSWGILKMRRCPALIPPCHLSARKEFYYSCAGLAEFVLSETAEA